MTTPTAPSAGAQAAVVRGNAVWLPPGAPPITVGNYVIDGGFIYVGSAVPAAYAPSYEPALIDPRAPVRRVRLDEETPASDARPAYADLTPGARAAYLEWLAGGRTDPAPAAHLWLFLYGLERRVLVDLAGSLDALAEYAAIAAELAALCDRYPHQTAFADHAADFADLLDALIGLGDPSLQPPPPGPRTGELPMRLRVGIGRYVARALPVSAGWAYAWYAYSPHRVWGPSATRRPEEFRRAFAARYAEAYPGGGIAVPAPDEGLVLEYQPASPGFADRTVRIHTQLPDVRELTGPLTELAEVAARAEADLSGTSAPPRGRPAPSPFFAPAVRPDGATATAGPRAPAATPAAAGAPAAPAAADSPAAPAAADGRTDASGRSGAPPSWPVDPQAPASPAAAPADPASPAASASPAAPPASAAPAASASSAASAASNGFAPDAAASADARQATADARQATADARQATADTHQATADAREATAEEPARRARTDARPQVVAAEALLRLVILAGIAEAYVRAVRRYVVDALALTVEERHGLDDRLGRFAHNRPDYTVVRRRFAALRTDDQRAITDLLIAAAGAQGVVEPAQAAVLAAVFDLLGPGAADLHQRLRDLEVAAVVGESTVDITVLDEEVVEATLADAPASAALIDALVAPPQRFATSHT